MFIRSHYITWHALYTNSFYYLLGNLHSDPFDWLSNKMHFHHKRTHIIPLLDNFLGWNSPLHFGQSSRRALIFCLHKMTLLNKLLNLYSIYAYMEIKFNPTNARLLCTMVFEFHSKITLFSSNNFFSFWIRSWTGNPRLKSVGMMISISCEQFNSSTFLTFLKYPPKTIPNFKTKKMFNLNIEFWFSQGNTFICWQKSCQVKNM